MHFTHFQNLKRIKSLYLKILLSRWRHITKMYYSIFADIQTPAGMMFMIFFKLYVSGLLCNIVTCWHDKCESYNLFNSLLGPYCPSDGIVTPNVSWPHCKLFCLHRPSCQAVNYNFTDHFCTYFTETCPIAVHHSDMAFALFTARRSGQCIEWIPNPNGRGHPVGKRLLTEDNLRYTARIQKDGNDYIGYIIWHVHHCYADTDEGRIDSKFSNDHPCQYLQVRYGCTIHFQSYEIGNPIPPNALIGGHTAEGHPVYVGRTQLGQIPSSYIPVYNRMVLGFNIAIRNVELLVVL